MMDVYEPANWKHISPSAFLYFPNGTLSPIQHSKSRRDKGIISGGKFSEEPCDMINLNSRNLLNLNKNLQLLGFKGTNGLTDLTNSGSFRPISLKLTILSKQLSLHQSGEIIVSPCLRMKKLSHLWYFWSELELRSRIFLWKRQTVQAHYMR